MGMFSRKKGDEWLDWLGDEQPDEAVQSELRAKKRHATPPQPVIIHPAASANDQGRRERLRRAGAYSQPPTPPHTDKAPKPGVAISININVPKLRGRKLPWQQVRYWSSFGAIVIMVAIVGRAGVGVVGDKLKEKKDVQGTTTVRAEPSFKPLAPSDKPDLGKVSADNTVYDSKRDLYTYKDTFTGSNIRVSQQAMPAAFKDSLKKDANKVVNPMLESLNIAKQEQVETAYGVAHFGFDDRANVQRVVLLDVDHSRFIFIESDRQFDSDAIKFYIESLREQG